MCMRLEVNMVVSHAREAGDYYKKLLGAEILLTTDENMALNEMVMKIGQTEIRVLNENKDFGMVAPSEVGTGSVWMNIWVEDIEAYFENAINEGANVLSPIQTFSEMSAKNAVISDKFKHVWVINQIF